MFVRLHEDFSSKYKIGKFVKNSDLYIPPVTVKLPPSEEGQIRTFQMVPLTELVPAVVAQAGFGSHPSNSGLLHDFVDGSSIKDNPFFKVKNYTTFTGDAVQSTGIIFCVSRSLEDLIPYR